MRTEPTFLEKRAGQALIDYLDSRAYVADPVFGDRPDLVMDLNGVATGIEIVSILPAKIHEAAKLHFSSLYKKGVPVGKLVVPIEPDEWVKAAIEKKWEIVNAYPKRSRPLRMSLLVHRPELRMDFEFADPGFINALSYGSARSKHGFDHVFYWAGDPIHLLAPPQANVPPRQVDLSKGYPAWIYVAHTRARPKGSDTPEPFLIPLAVPPEHTKVIRPTTPEFRGLRPLEPEGDLRIEIGYDGDFK